MTRDQIDVLWHKAMQIAVSKGDDFTRYEFASLVVAAEREACAKVCMKEYPEFTDGLIEFIPCFDTPAECAEAIRERGKP